MFQFTSPWLWSQSLQGLCGIYFKIEMNNLCSVDCKQTLNLITNEQKIKGPWRKLWIAYILVFQCSLSLSLGIKFCYSSKRLCSVSVYKLKLFGFSHSPWMVSSRMGQAFSTKSAGASKMAMMNGPQWLWQMYPNTLSRARRPLLHTWWKFRPSMTWALLQSQLQSWAILEKTVSVCSYFFYTFPLQKGLAKV